MGENEERMDFPNEERRILSYWDEIDAFHTSLKLSEGKPAYTFLDGPPFATGLPHYGHLLAGTIKDTVLRYAAQNGFHVERKFGWDCHGLPVEYEIDKKLGITSKADVEAFGGIAKYNAECRAIVMRYSSQWEETVRRIGRWIDFKDDYKTMYPSFMESVWWVFKELFGKGAVYRGWRVMPYSTACTTPLSNFEVKQNYKDVTDPSITVVFPILESTKFPAGTGLLVWTTTPWTLPSNLGIAVKAEMTYVLVSKDSVHYVLAKSRLAHVFPGKQPEILKEFPGSELCGLRYEPPFGFFLGRSKEFPKTHTVVPSDHVTDESGTGLVHLAPGFGEEDFAVCLREGLTHEEDVPCPIDDKGCYVAPVTHADLLGKYVKDADSVIIKMLGTRLFHRTQITHSYPFCWRSDTPLIYRTVSCWFVRVTPIIPDILEASKQSRWVPEFVQEKRFHNWIEGAHDWAISRNRYWGTPIPLWVSEDMQEVVCVGSIAELCELTGAKDVTDLHRESIDHLTIPSWQGKGTLRRIDEVLDCWFESGAVPYAQCHYPFEGKEKFEASFPADFIGEGLDQTRGWFYTLMVLGTHLFKKAPFRNLIVNGLVLAADGKKMSKRLKNYPEPALILDKYGADALRLYLINSPVVAAETLKFKEDGVFAVVKDVLLPWWHSYRFFQTQVEVWEKETSKKFSCGLKSEGNLENATDAWIMATLQSLIKTVRTEMDGYRLSTVLPPLLRFIDSLTNGYIRFNRKRLRGELGTEEAHVALQTLFSVLWTLDCAMAPFAPFFSENIHQRLLPFLAGSEKKSLGDVRSVHFLPFPVVNESLYNAPIERAFRTLLTVVERVRMMREGRSLPIKMPLASVTVITTDVEVKSDLESLRAYALAELNVRDLKFDDDEAGNGIRYRACANFRELGARLKGDMAKVKSALEALPTSDLKAFMTKGEVTVCGHVLTTTDLEVRRELVSTTEDSSFAIACEKEFAVRLACTVSEELRREGLARDLVSRVQKLRKQAGLHPTQDVLVALQADDGIKAVIASQMDFLTRSLRSISLNSSSVIDAAALIIEDTQGAFEGESGTLAIRLIRQ